MIHLWFLNPCKDYNWILEIKQMSILFWRHSLENSLQMALGYSPACTKSHQILPNVKPRPEHEHIRNSRVLVFWPWLPNPEQDEKVCEQYHPEHRICRNLILMLNIFRNGINNEKKIRRLQCFFILSRERLWRSNSTENDLGSHASKEKLYSSHLYQIDTWMKNFLI